jgi:leucyl aminopeptidase (aminopeptidase T)
VNRALDRVYQDAVLRLDTAALRRTMNALRDVMTGAEMRVTNPAGTDLRFRMSGLFMMNDGDASREKVADAKSARDREEEIPCGAIRTIPVLDSVEGVIAFRGGFGFPSPGYGLDVNRWYDHGLRFVFEKGHVVRVETDGDQAELDRQWAANTGDKDRLGEFVLGCNPWLKPVPGSTFQPYYGFGDGILRLTIGENLESGGTNVSSLHRWLYLLDATITANGATLVQDGRIVAPA